MDHSVITAFVDYESTYGGEKWALPFKPPPQDIRQGNGAAPAIWELVSTSILYCLQ